MSRLIKIFAVLTVGVLVREASATCFYRNGTATSTDYSPCSSDSSNALSTVCCARWDTCLPNGLCQSFDKVIWRESCTKQNWDDGGCQEMCSNEREAQRNDNIQATPCSGNTTSSKWCCGGNNNCCTEGSGIQIYTLAAKFGDAIPTASSTRSSAFATSFTSTSSTSLSQSSSSASVTASSANNSGISTGAKAGIGIGVAAGAVAVVALGIFVFKALQWRKRAQAVTPEHESPEAYTPTEIYGYQTEMKPAQLAGTESTVHELPDSRYTSEMGVQSTNKTNVAISAHP